MTLANKRAQIQKLSDASLGKFDVDESRVAFLDPSGEILVDKKLLGCA